MVSGNSPLGGDLTIGIGLFQLKIKATFYPERPVTGGNKTTKGKQQLFNNEGTTQHGSYASQPEIRMLIFYIHFPSCSYKIDFAEDFGSLSSLWRSGIIPTVLGVADIL